MYEMNSPKRLRDISHFVKGEINGCSFIAIVFQYSRYRESSAVQDSERKGPARKTVVVSEAPHGFSKFNSHKIRAQSRFFSQREVNFALPRERKREGGRELIVVFAIAQEAPSIAGEN